MKVSVSLAHHAKTWISEDLFPSLLTAWDSGDLAWDDCGTHFGFVGSGEALIECESGWFCLTTGMYFSCPGALNIQGTGIGFVATRLDWRGFFQLGGPVEQKGRLRYIDGCSDSLLISPVVFGDPCLNLLYLPPHTQQTAHTHPSCRFGMILSGKGICKTPERDILLEPGMIFFIQPEAMHSFHTTAQPLRVIAWHPDSDCGPAHHDHPMINRTIIDGISAAKRIEATRSQRS